MSTWTTLRAATRTLLRSPRLSLTVTALLALGLGAATALFALLDYALLRPLPIARPQEVVRVFLGAEPPGGSAAYPVYRHLAEGTQALVGLAAFSDGAAVDLAVAGRPAERVSASLVSGNFFPLLGVRPVLGRLLAPADDAAPGRGPVAVLAEPFWRRAFAADPAVVGRSVTLNRVAFTVVGVAPAGFNGPSLEVPPDLWVPTAMVDEVMPSFKKARPLHEARLSWLDMVGRLRPGATAAQAAAELSARGVSWHRLAGASEQSFDGVRVAPAGRERYSLEAGETVTRIGRTLGLMAGLLLLLVCAVAGSLLLVRATRRRRELAIRLALGAGRAALARGLLAEAVVLALAAVTLAPAVAWGIHRALAAFLPPDVPLAAAAGAPLLAPRVLAFGAAAALLSTLLFGLLPALAVMRADLTHGLRGGLVTPLLGGRLPAARAWLVLQVALTVTVLSAAGLLLRTLWQTAAVPTGFIADGAVVASVSLARAGYDPERGAAFFRSLEEAVAALPGAQHAALASHVPVRGSGVRVTVLPEGYTAGEEEDMGVDFDPISADYFATLGIPLVAGRPFAAADDANGAPVAIVNQAFVARFWKGQPAVGRRIADVGIDSATVEVVGVVADHQSRSLREPQAPTLYLPLRQSYSQAVTVVVRGTPGAEPALLAALRATLGRLDPQLPLNDAMTLSERLATNLARERALAMLLTSFGATALLLALLGLSSALAFATEMRTRELGLRVAVGAQRRQVGWLVVAQALGVTAAGCTLGLGGALLASRALSGLLFGVEPWDPLTLGAVVAVLLLTAALAAWLPARRASGVDPLVALRA